VKRERLKDVLDYPLEGSPHHQPREPSVDRLRARESSALAVEDLAYLPDLVSKLGRIPYKLKRCARLSPRQ
jgi:hypothetical protein